MFHCHWCRGSSKTLPEQTDLGAAVAIPVAHHRKVAGLCAHTEAIHLVGGRELPVAIVIQKEEAIAGPVYAHLRGAGAVPVPGDGNIARNAAEGVDLVGWSIELLVTIGVQEPQEAAAKNPGITWGCHGNRSQERDERLVLCRAAHGL